MKLPHALVDIVAALALFVLASLATAWWSGLLPTGLRIPAVIVIQGGLVLGIVALFLARRDQRWAHIGLVAFRGGDLLRGLLAFAACLAANLLLVYLLYSASPATVEQHSDRLGSIARRVTGDMTLPWLMMVLAFVGVYEEVFARGFLLERCRRLMGGTAGPVLVSSLLFGLGHLYQGWLGVGQTMLVGIVLAAFTLRWGTLWPAIIAHATLDIFSVLVMGSFADGLRAQASPH